MTSLLSDSEKMPWKEMASEKDQKTMWGELGLPIDAPIQLQFVRM